MNGLRFLYALLPFFVRRFLYAAANASIIGVTGSSLSGLDRYSNRVGQLIGQSFAVSILIADSIQLFVRTRGLGVKLFHPFVTVLNGNKADTHERKGAFQIVSRFDVVTRKTGKVFDADQIDFAALDLLHHLRELRTVKVRAGITVIRKLRPLTARQLRMIVKKAIDEHTRNGKILPAAVQRRQPVVLTGDKPAVFIKDGLHSKFVMLKEQVLFGGSVVGVLRA